MFIILEGPDGAGKTAVAKKAAELDEALKYSQAFTRDSGRDAFIHRHPCSVFYYLDIAMKTRRTIKPLLAKGFTVLQDRYVQSVDSYLPDCTWLHNKAVRAVLDSYFLRPDAYVHVTASLDEMLRRLSGDCHEEYHAALVQHPERIQAREQRYMQIYAALGCPKQILDTTGKNPDDCARELIDFVRRIK